MNNIILQTDSYKLGGHWNMLIEGTTKAYGYGECRLGSKYPFSIFFGLQAIIQEHLAGVVVEQWMLEEAKEISLHHLGREEALNIKGWQRIIDVHGGKLPIKIKAVAEGMKVPVGNALFVIESTDDELPWIGQYVEGLIMKFWYPTTVCTQSYLTVEIAKKYQDLTSDLVDFHKFMIHDFGYRSATCENAAEIGGGAHLVNSLGTDTVPALKWLKTHYKAEYNEIGFSVPATEHFIATSFGDGGGETDYVKSMLDKYPDGILSLVSDSYGIENFVTNVIGGLKYEISKRREDSDNEMTALVIRPDSPRFEGDTHEDQVLWIIKELGKIFGYETNSKGYRCLPPFIKCLDGDGIAFEEVENIYKMLADNGWSSQNCLLGQGSGLLNDCVRDTQRVAIKCSAQIRNGELLNIQKNPSDKTKASKTGLLKLVKMTDDEGVMGYHTINQLHPLYHDLRDEMLPIFVNGELVKEYTLQEVRNNTNL
jgi:nicotinamide phosphoribosyltransferase